ncbi:hypothetical protein GH714_025550 [Hevea brasiliensis]|uniref:Uncharacterized protein n=1 Tax=Hevea brasiliensis TaxID=3981 RepID=A0A6A6MFG4_HEVBR|nr:hypothetical protein GH714_025550 [Hevea brasiliensis]
MDRSTQLSFDLEPEEIMDFPRTCLSQMITTAAAAIFLLSWSNGTSPVHIDALEAALAEASTANKTLIIAIVNKAYVEGDKPMLDRDIRVVSTVHANCCRTISAKIAALTAVIQNWKMLKSSSAAMSHPHLEG